MMMSPTRVFAKESADHELYVLSQDKQEPQWGSVSG